MGRQKCICYVDKISSMIYSSYDEHSIGVYSNFIDQFQEIESKKDINNIENIVTLVKESVTIDEIIKLKNSGLI